MPIRCSSWATRAAIFSNPSSPKRRCSSSFELLRHRIVFLRGNQLLQFRKEIGILARGMRPVHRYEGLHGSDQLPPPVAIAAGGRRKADDGLRQLSSRRMLAQQGVDQIGHLAGLLEAGKDMGLLRLLMIIVDEVADDFRRLRDQAGIEVFLGVEFPQARFVNQQHPVQHAMLAHQILRRGYLLLAPGDQFPGLFGNALLFGARGGGEERRRRHAGGKAAAEAEHLAFAGCDDCHGGAFRWTAAQPSGT